MLINSLRLKLLEIFLSSSSQDKLAFEDGGTEVASLTFRDYIKRLIRDEGIDFIKSERATRGRFSGVRNRLKRGMNLEWSTELDSEGKENLCPKDPDWISRDLCDQIRVETRVTTDPPLTMTYLASTYVSRECYFVTHVYLLRIKY